MRYVKTAARWFVDFIEVYLPIGMFILLFIAFITNVFFRYVLRDPQTWTFEFCVYAFVMIGLLGACAANRKEDHVVFDLIYTRLTPKGQSIFRIISLVIVIAFLLGALPAATLDIMYIRAKTSIMRIPEQVFFISLPILMISTVIRYTYRLVLDIKAFRNKTYAQTYNTNKTETDALI
jgi:TRAP-type C4-dicarboxylate transport system permease small subunit